MFEDRLAKCLLPLPEKVLTASNKLNKLISQIRIGPVANLIDMLSRHSGLGSKDCSPARLCSPLGDFQVFPSNLKKPLILTPLPLLSTRITSARSFPHTVIRSFVLEESLLAHHISLQWYKNYVVAVFSILRNPRYR
jgi:hypothetical protein